MEEEWRAIKEYEGLYEISNLGRVKSLYDGRHKIFREKLLRPRESSCSYLQVCLVKEGERKWYSVHRLVLMAFSPVKNMNELLVNHINEKKDDNRLENLEWCTALYNLTYNDRHKKIGEKNTNGKNSIPLVQIDPSTNKIVNVWKSSHDAARGGYNQGAINSCCKNKFNREGNNIYKGFKWMYLYSYIGQIDPRIKKVILFGKEYYFNN